MTTIHKKNPPVQPKPVKLTNKATGEARTFSSVRSASLATGASPAQVRRAIHSQGTVHGHRAEFV